LEVTFESGAARGDAMKGCSGEHARLA
jgi:hypothetical protein